MEAMMTSARVHGHVSLAMDDSRWMLEVGRCCSTPGKFQQVWFTHRKLLYLFLHALEKKAKGRINFGSSMPVVDNSSRWRVVEKLSFPFLDTRNSVAQGREGGIDYLLESLCASIISNQRLQKGDNWTCTFQIPSNHQCRPAHTDEHKTRPLILQACSYEGDHAQRYLYVQRQCICL